MRTFFSWWFQLFFFIFVVLVRFLLWKLRVPLPTLWLILDWVSNRPYGSANYYEFFVESLRFDALRMLSFVWSNNFRLVIVTVDSRISIKLVALASPYLVEPGGGRANCWPVITELFRSSMSRKLIFSLAISYTLNDLIGGGPLVANLVRIVSPLFSL